MTKPRLGVLFGGRSGEHEISIISARSVIRAADRTKYSIVPLGITKEGRWLCPAPSLDLLVACGGDDLRGLPLPDGPQFTWEASLLPPAAALAALDVVFPVLHGPYGEDGTVQGLLELADVPYVGAGVAASAVGMDKALQKAILCRAGLPVVRYRTVLRSVWERHPQEVMDAIEAEFPYPCFVKPVNLGSSVGISKVRDREALALALFEAAQLDRKVLVEEGIPAREIECAVLGNEEPQASVVGEIIPHREFYDYEAKYHDDRTELVVPADLPRHVAEEVRELALQTYRALDCAGMGRVDFFLDRNTGRVYVNELNTIPGFTSVSMYPRLWEASGLPYPDLIDRLVALALERHQDKRRTRRTTRDE
ncbi:MAG: D-alanine--D-alanine ligase [Chloroflexi bacterium]|nr:D-alanine--D-alanine ligase [Chloroflexota bacterium]